MPLLRLPDGDSTHKVINSKVIVSRAPSAADQGQKGKPCKCPGIQRRGGGFSGQVSPTGRAWGENTGFAKAGTECGEEEGKGSHNVQRQSEHLVGSAPALPWGVGGAWTFRGITPGVPASIRVRVCPEGGCICKVLFIQQQRCTADQLRREIGNGKAVRI